MLSEELRRKIEILNRAPFPFSPGDRAEIAKILRRKVGSARDAEESFASSGRVVTGAHGKCCVMERPLEEVCGPLDETAREYDRVFLGGAANVPAELLRPELEACLGAAHDKVLFLDIETTGLSGGPLFLIGFLYRQGRTFSVVQMLARDYAEEAALLDQAAGFSSGFEIIVSFNGSSFDLPILRERSIVHGVDCTWAKLHLDLLHEARRRWRHVLPNCRLQTLEAIVCGRTRTGDIPSQLIPEAYHEFVRTGNPFRMKDIVRHNALDLRTMVQLLVLMLENKLPYHGTPW